MNGNYISFNVFVSQKGPLFLFTPLTYLAPDFLHFPARFPGTLPSPFGSVVSQDLKHKSTIFPGSTESVFSSNEGNENTKMFAGAILLLHAGHVFRLLMYFIGGGSNFGGVEVLHP